jgi:outer membrane protein assembly factor BamB
MPERQHHKAGHAIDPMKETGLTMTTATFRTFVAALAGLLLMGGRPAGGADWPMFGRDQSRNAVSPEKGPPIHWQVEERENGSLVQPAWNIKWVAALGSGNVPSPVVANGLIWVGTNNARPRDPKLKKDAAVLMCFRERDGKFLWQYVSERLSQMEIDKPYSGIHCAPLVEGDRLWFTTNRCEVVCLDIGLLRAGKGDPRPIWKLDMRKKFRVHPVNSEMNWGLTCSIGATYKGRIYVITGNGVNATETVPAPNAPSLLCLDKNTGKVLWKDRSPGKNILYGQWSSPLVIEIKGRGQVITPQGDGWVRSFDALRGKLIWKLDTNPKASQGKPLPKRMRNSLLATPVFHQGRVYIANGRAPELGSTWGRLYSIDPTKEGDISPEVEDGSGRVKPNLNSGAIWCFNGYGDQREDRMNGVFANVAVLDGLVIAPDSLGFIHCLDARTGRRHWVHDVKAEIIGSPLIVDGKVYVANDDGDVTVLALSRHKRLIAVNEMIGSVRAPPVFANGVLYVATRWHLYAIKSGAPTGRVRDRAPGHWPQWRGVGRTNVSRETGLLKKWPRMGPPLAWKARGLGESTASVAVAGGRVYTLGKRGENDWVTALDEATGKKIWSRPLGRAMKDNPLMRWLSQRTPTVDDDRLYAFTARGDLVCLAAADGKEAWRKSYSRDWGGTVGSWGCCDRPLVDGQRLICVPGGSKATVVALDKKTGQVVWKRAVPGRGRASYAATVVADVGQIRHYLVFLGDGLVGVAARDGKFLWRYDKISNGTANTYSPIVQNDLIFCASGYGRGIALLKLRPQKGSCGVEEVYYYKKALPPWHESTVLFENHVYLGTGGAIACLELMTGKQVWNKRDATGGNVAVVCAEGHLYLRSPAGLVALVEATPKEYRLKGAFRIPGAAAKPGSTAPVIAGGRLYLRDDDVLFCYDVKEGVGVRPAVPVDPDPRKNGDSSTRPSSRLKGAREPDAVFVPTPQDVVEKMLELAQVKRGHLVYDLGCGDGRIVVTAALKYGCKAVGYDIDPECVKMSREMVKEHRVGGLVTIEQKDIFTLDLSKAGVVTLYLLPRMNQRLIPQLEKLKPGARIVSHAFEIPGIPPDRVVIFMSKEDKIPHKIYLWTTPLKKSRPKK